MADDPPPHDDLLARFSSLSVANLPTPAAAGDLNARFARIFNRPAFATTSPTAAAAAAEPAAADEAVDAVFRQALDEGDGFDGDIRALATELKDQRTTARTDELDPAAIAALLHESGQLTDGVPEYLRDAAEGTENADGEGEADAAADAEADDPDELEAAAIVSQQLAAAAMEEARDAAGAPAPADGADPAADPPSDVDAIVAQLAAEAALEAANGTDADEPSADLVSRLAALQLPPAPVPALPTAPSLPAPLPSVPTSGYSRKLLDDAELGCCMCSDDVQFRCRGCERDDDSNYLYCSKCFQLSHMSEQAGYDERFHKYEKLKL
ncbi:uncharacterized protein V1510DRAFT_443067 [Dipodascopsis tothii]|uniref:uncharacterized protein n=1 Tax=Dipodascopsis tothii TaxID=44089 RepID=UPI0034CF8977